MQDPLNGPACAVRGRAQASQAVADSCAGKPRRRICSYRALQNRSRGLPQLRRTPRPLARREIGDFYRRVYHSPGKAPGSTPDMSFPLVGSRPRPSPPAHSEPATTNTTSTTSITSTHNAPPPALATLSGSRRIPRGEFVSRVGWGAVSGRSGLNFSGSGRPARMPRATRERRAWASEPTAPSAAGCEFFRRDFRTIPAPFFDCGTSGIGFRGCPDLGIFPSRPCGRRCGQHRSP